VKILEEKEKRRKKEKKEVLDSFYSTNKNKALCDTKKKTKQVRAGLVRRLIWVEE
jgi:hypothetical protein